MISEKLFTEEELNKEKELGAAIRYTNMLKHNIRLLTERLEAAIGFLELQETHLPEHIGFMWREIVIQEK